MKNITLRQLRVFTAVARQLSFSTAARDLNLSQPAASMQVRHLEENVGLPLFERVGKRLRVTEAGERLLSYSALVGELLDEARESIDELRGLRGGTLKLSAVGSAAYFAPSVLSQFLQQFPGITVRYISANWYHESLEQLRRAEIDLVIVGHHVKASGVLSEPFARNQYVFVARPDHPLAGKRRIPLSKLANEKLITRERQSGTRTAIESRLKARRLTSITIQEMNNQEAIKQATMAGMGIGFISIHSAGLELSTGRLITLNVEGFPAMGDWHLVRLAERKLSPTCGAFREFVLSKGARIIESATGIASPKPRRSRNPGHAR